MTDATDGRPFDWDRHWKATGGAPRGDAGPAAEYVLEALRAFLAAADPPGSYADVGCGDGAVALDVAERYPDADVRGYDVAEAVLVANRDRAREAGLGNVRFEGAELPAFDPDRCFDVVSCLFTLCYVRDVEAALRRLYDAVRPGGALVFTYHNRLARARLREVAAAPGEYLDESSRFDPDHYADRFRPVLEGESLLSYERVHDALGTWPRSVWSVAEGVERYGAWRHNPLVWVPK